jgi:hypothetical protein
MLFDPILNNVDGERIIAALDSRWREEDPVTVGNVGCLSLQVRMLFDPYAVPDPDSPEGRDPGMWQAVGVEVALCLYGEVLARESLWGIWLWLGSRDKVEYRGFPDYVKSTIVDLAHEANSRLEHEIGRRLDRLSSAQSLVKAGYRLPGTHASVSI